MIPHVRQDFNRRFQPTAYARLLQSMRRRCGTDIGFRISETPCFVPRTMMATLVKTGVELVHQLVDNPVYMERSTEAIPKHYLTPHESRKPLFLGIDFGWVREADGSLSPRLVELQAFASVHGFQAVLCEEYQSHYGLDPSWRYLLSDPTVESYWRRWREALLANHAPENVVLTDLQPSKQRTLPDFNVIRERLGLSIVDVTQLVQQGRRLFYRDDRSRLVPIHRIYNRTIMDDLEREHRCLPFDLRDELEVEWAGHPNWFFRISKFSIPFLQHPCVPRAIFLDELEQKRHLLPERREDWVLKPLFSFAGQGIRFGPTDEELATLPETERRHYLLEERVPFAPLIDTPAGPTQAEFRVMYLWPEREPDPLPLISLVRMGRGLMMGTRYNRDQPWVGASAAFMD